MSTYSFPFPSRKLLKNSVCSAKRMPKFRLQGLAMKGMRGVLFIYLLPLLPADLFPPPPLTPCLQRGRSPFISPLLACISFDLTPSRTAWLSSDFVTSPLLTTPNTEIMIGALFSERKEFLTAPAGSWQVGYVDVMTEGSPKLSSFTRWDAIFSFIARVCSLFLTVLLISRYSMCITFGVPRD
jgi:hypothetical protein